MFNGAVGKLGVLFGRWRIPWVCWLVITVGCVDELLDFIRCIEMLFGWNSWVSKSLIYCNGLIDESICLWTST